jgi:predicted nucleotidyltransferase
MNFRRNDKLLEELLCEMRNRLGFHLKQVILFGSRARGEEVSGSDYDILVIVDEISPQVKNIIDEISGDFLYHNNVVFSIFPVLEDYFYKENNEIIRYETMRFFEERSKRFNEEDFLDALKEIPAVEPEERDRLNVEP